MTRFEYNKTVLELVNDGTNPANSLPAEVSGNGFGNDADEQPSSAFLIEQYGIVAADVAARFVASAEFDVQAPCARTATAENEASCARSFIETFTSRAYRRPVQAAEVDELVALQQGVRQELTFLESLSTVVEAVLQAPDYLYRIEHGEPDAVDPTLRRPTNHEMATRLSYFFWGTMPDEELEAAANAGMLQTSEGVMDQARRMLDDDKTRETLRHFFDHFLPLNTLTDLSRDAEQYPTFSATIGSLMREETHRFLQYEIFEGPGDWRSALTAPYTFVNGPLAEFYGFTGVTGDEWVKYDNLDTTKRLGLLTQGAIQAGTTISNFTNPVRRGTFLLRHMMCIKLPDPPESFANDIMPPDPYSGDTARERYTIHSEQPECAACHKTMDPPGFGLENYDAVGLWRDQENGVTIDASGTLAPQNVPFNGPIELVQAVANSQQTHDCFATTWADFAYGRKLDSGDSCTTNQLKQAFTDSGYNVRELLLALTQTDAFLYLPPAEQL